MKRGDEMDRVIQEANQEKRNLFEHECMALLKEYGVSVPRHALVKTESEAMRAAEEIGYPVVLKVVSREILHKSDVGGVKVNLKTADELRSGFEAIRQSIAKHVPGAIVEGMLVMENVSPGVECIVGMTRDPQFGAAMMFGLGGIFVEVMEDVSLCLLPVSKEEAIDMIHSIKGYRLLSGYRGGEPCDIDAIADVILNVSRLVEDHPEIKEIDINPLFAYPRSVLPVDARILI